MTAKRFILSDTGYIYDKQDKAICPTLESVVRMLNELHEENQELKRLVKATVKDYTDLKQSFDLIDKENEQLKERNDRQAKQLDNLYRLIEKKDWRTLTDIMDDFKKAEEQLQREWGTYGDWE